MDGKYEPYSSSNAQEEMGQTSLRKERVCYKLQEDHLNWPNNQITIKPLLTL